MGQTRNLLGIQNPAIIIKKLRPRRSLEVRGSPELQKGGLRALEEAWDDFLLEAFFPANPIRRKGF